MTDNCELVKQFVISENETITVDILKNIIKQSNFTTDSLYVHPLMYKQIMDICRKLQLEELINNIDYKPNNEATDDTLEIVVSRITPKNTLLLLRNNNMPLESTIKK